MGGNSCIHTCPRNDSSTDVDTSMSQGRVRARPVSSTAMARFSCWMQATDTTDVLDASYRHRDVLDASYTETRQRRPGCKLQTQRLLDASYTETRQRCPGCKLQKQRRPGCKLQTQRRPGCTEATDTTETSWMQTTDTETSWMQATNTKTLWPVHGQPL